MQAPDIPANEARRLQALHDLEVLDTPTEESFDRLTQLARDIFDVPVALVSLIDAKRQWFKSHAVPDRPSLADVFCPRASSADGACRPGGSVAAPKYASTATAG
jgi:hypothetical protein